jgi:chromosome segregation ATPase
MSGGDGDERRELTLERIEARLDRLLEEQRAQGAVLKAVADKVLQFGHRFDGLDARLDQVDDRLATLEQRQAAVEKRLGAVERRLALIAAKPDLAGELEALRARIAALEPAP